MLIVIYATIAYDTAIMYMDSEKISFEEAVACAISDLVEAVPELNKPGTIIALTEQTWKIHQILGGIQ